MLVVGLYVGAQRGIRHEGLAALGAFRLLRATHCQRRGGRARMTGEKLVFFLEKSVTFIISKFERK